LIINKRKRGTTMRRLMVGVWLLAALGYALNRSTDIPDDDAAKHQVNAVATQAAKPVTLESRASRAQPLPADTPSHKFAAEEASYEEPVEWVKVAQTAAAHSKPSVSSPTTYRYQKGKELQVLQRELPWVEVLDPVTKFRGWVLHIYLSSPNVSIARSTSAPDPEKVGSPVVAAIAEEEPQASERQQASKVKLSSAKPKQSKAGQRANRESRKAARAKSRGYEEYAEPPLYTRRGYRRGYAFERYAARPYYANTYRERRFLARPPGFIRFRGLF
jgi:hypothetical protein